MPRDVRRSDGATVTPGRGIPMCDVLALTKMPDQTIRGDDIPTGIDPINVGPCLTLDSLRIDTIRPELMAHGYGDGARGDEPQRRGPCAR